MAEDDDVYNAFCNHTVFVDSSRFVGLASSKDLTLVIDSGSDSTVIG